MSMNLDPIVFTEEQLKRISIPVTLGDQEYILKEADGAAITERDNSVVNGTVLENGKPTRMTGLGAIDAVLLSRCLFRKNGTQVQLKFVQDLPARVREALVDRLKEISRIDDSEEDAQEDEEELGNLSSDTEDGSD